MPPVPHHCSALTRDYIDNYFIGIRRAKNKQKEFIWKAHFYENGKSYENYFPYTEEGLRKAALWCRNWMYDFEDDHDVELVPTNKKVDTLTD